MYDTLFPFKTQPKKVTWEYFLASRTIRSGFRLEPNSLCGTNLSSDKLPQNKSLFYALKTMIRPSRPTLAMYASHFFLFAESLTVETPQSAAYIRIGIHRTSIHLGTMRIRCWCLNESLSSIVNGE